MGLDVNDLIQLEVQRQTEIGKTIQDLLTKGRNVWSEPMEIVKILKKIIYSGVEGNDKFLLIGFPDQIDHSQIFEKMCSKISAIVYTTAKGQPTVEVKGDDLSLLNIDSLFAKQFRLKTMEEWDASTFEEHLGKKVNWGLLTGRSLSGKTAVANALCSIIKAKVINMATIQESIKKSLGTEEEPFEGEVPIDKVEEHILNTVAADRAANNKFTYLFDGWLHPSTEQFVNVFYIEFGLPSFSIHCHCDTKVVQDRFKKKNEVDDVTEEAAAELEDQRTKAEGIRSEVDGLFERLNIKQKLFPLSTDCSFETTLKNLKALFSAKVILLNHEKRLNVDTTCSNIAIKYNMLYISVYQTIREHILGNTSIGKQLLASKKPKLLSQISEELSDPYEETQYSAVHFDYKLVTKLICDTIAEKRSNQSHILLEGFGNNKKLEEESDRLAVRNMDELFNIEKNIGEVVGVINLTYNVEPSEFKDEQWEKFDEPVVVAKPA